MTRPLPIRATLALALLSAVAGCVAPPAAPPPPPPPVPAPPAPAPAPDTAWDDAPLSPGSWRYAEEPGGSAALFGEDARLTLRCDRAGRRLILARAGAAAAPAPGMTVRTSFGAVALPAAGMGARVELSRPASDPLFDQIAFSRGRFAVEVAGLERIVAPTFAEVARVVEDCRG